MVARGAPVSTALVIGGSGTLGSEIVQRLHLREYQLAVHYHRERTSANKTASAVGGFAISADVRDWDSVKLMVAQVEERFGSSIGVLVNSAGLRRDGLMAGQSPQEWREVIDVNLAGTFHACRAALPGMLRAHYGRIINVISPAAMVGSPGQTAYSAAKAGIVGMSRTLAHECGKRGVTVNCLSPGLMESALTAAIRPEIRAAVLERAAVGGLVDPAEVAASIDMILDSHHLTAQVVSIDGGISP